MQIFEESGLISGYRQALRHVRLSLRLPNGTLGQNRRGRVFLAFVLNGANVLMSISL